MAIEKFTTRGLILNQYIYGEHDVMIKAYTEDFGVIMVLAKSLRKRESKLKAHVRKYHYVSLTIVKGREIYRLTGATEILFNNKKQNLIAEISKLIERLYGGEIKQASLFNKIFNYIQHYHTNKSHINYHTNKNHISYNSKEPSDLEGQHGAGYNIYRMAIYSIILIELGHMDAEVLGIGDIKEYKAMTEDVMLLNVSLYRHNINKELHRAIRESML